MTDSTPDALVQGFADLFMGFPTAYGTGKGGWVHSPPTTDDYAKHLAGKGDGLGIGPLLPDGTCWFAAIDLDRPDFELARNLMKLLPGVSWLERSRSGNAHVLVFFKVPCAAWIVRGIMREALAAYGERSVEVFPKADRLLPGMVGNYLNLPCFGDTRPILGWQDAEGFKPGITVGAGDSWVVPTSGFVQKAKTNLNDPRAWATRANWLGVPSPETRAKDTTRREFGSAATLHLCAQHVIEHRDDSPVMAGHRAVVYFVLSKCLANWSEIGDDEALDILALVNDSSPDPIDMQEMRRIYENVKRGQFTSTGCDDPLFQPYAHPDCKIAKGLT